MLERAQRPSPARGLHITLPSVMPLVAHPAGQEGRQAGGKTSQSRPLGRINIARRCYATILPIGTMPPMSLIHPAFGIGQTFYMPPTALIRKPDDMLSSPLGQHILDYEPPHGFVIPAFSTFDGSTGPYDHMLHYNQVMILNAYNDRLLCKVFPSSLRGPKLVWFHKLPRN